MNARWLSVWLVAAGLFMVDAAQAAPPAVSAKVDAQIRAAWKDARIQPAPPVDDARFLRRAWLDLAGTLPPPDAVTRFLDDTKPDKRSRALDELLAGPAYAERWSDYWDAVLMGRLTREAFIDRGAFKEWLREQFAKNEPWDDFVRTLLTAEGYNTNKHPKGAASDPADLTERYHPATNWFLRYSRALPELAGATTKTFLGVQLQCAQCHDHKTEKWTQTDFRQFTAFFAKTWPAYYDKTLVLGILRLDTKDRLTTPPMLGKLEQYFGSYKEYTSLTPKPLGGPEVRSFKSRRVELANWVTDKKNPYFAQAIVNRMWGELLGRGFVEPIDDFRPSNPPVLPEALDALAEDFVANNYDLRHLIRAICHTEAYQLACHTPAGGAATSTSAADAGRLWASYPLKQLEIETLLRSILAATDTQEHLDNLTKGRLDLVRGAFARQFVTQLGTDDMAEVSQAEETIPRALLFLNGALINGATRCTPGFGLGEILKGTSDDKARIETLYLRTFSRRPTSSETATWLAYVGAARPVVSTPGPAAASTPTGLAAMRTSPEIMGAKEDADFKELLNHAKTGADFAALAKRMKNNADAGLFVKSFEAWAGEFPFQVLAGQGGGSTPKEQAYENLYWALLNSTEFLTNH